MKSNSSSSRRSGRRNANVYKKGDYVECFINGGTVTGRLLEKRAARSTSPTSSGELIWIVCPSDRRRRNEEVPESALGRVIDVDEAMNNKSLAKATRNLQNGNNGNFGGSNSDDSDQGDHYDRATEEGGHFDDDPVEAGFVEGSGEGFYGGEGGEGEGGFSEEPSSNANNNAGYKKRKGDDSTYGDSRSVKRKTVTFQDGGNYSPNIAAGTGTTAATATFSSSSKQRKAASRIGTRSSTRGNGSEDFPHTSNNFNNLDLLPTNLLKKKKKKKTFKGIFKGNLGKGKVNKDENVVVVKMLTGTLYLIRGERPRAEFVRSK